MGRLLRLFSFGLIYPEAGCDPSFFRNLRLYNDDSSTDSPTGMYVDELHTAWDESYGWHDYTLAYTNIGTTATRALVGSTSMLQKRSATGLRTHHPISVCNCARFSNNNNFDNL